MKNGIEMMRITFKRARKKAFLWLNGNLLFSSLQHCFKYYTKTSFLFFFQRFFSISLTFIIYFSIRCYFQVFVFLLVKKSLTWIPSTPIRVSEFTLSLALMTVAYMKPITICLKIKIISAFNANIFTLRFHCI